MRRRIASLLGLGAVLSAALVWLVAAPVVSAGDPCYHGFDQPTATTVSATTIALEPCAFTPTTASVPVGATVTFKNPGQFTHLITGANQEWGDRDVEVAPGKTVTYTFDKAGIFPYACALHRGMSGVIVVGGAEALGAAAVGSTSGTNTGTTANTSSMTAAPPAAATPTSSAATMDALPLVLVAAVAGIVIGGVGGWLISRRRTVPKVTAVTPAA